MSIWKPALLGAMIPLGFAMPVAAQQGPGGPPGPMMIFEEFDLDGDGAVTLEEVRGMREARFAEADANGDGALDRDELLAAGQARLERGVDRMLDRADADGDGALTAEEMAEARPGPRRGPNAERLFERIDADGDGRVTEAEFDEAMAEFRERRGGHRFGWGRDRG